MKIFEGLEGGLGPSESNASKVDFLMVVGDGRDDEVIFRWANGLAKETVEYVTTVSLGNHNTEAGYTLTQGVTGKSKCPTIPARI
jgi:trehalose-6-phosphatase